MKNDKELLNMKEYTKDKLFDIIDTTQMNYANMLKRLDRKAKFSNFVAIYYSIALIVYSLTVKYYSDFYDENLSSYFSIIISIVILAYSIVNSNANYSERIKNAEYILNSTKTLKRELTDNNLDDIKKKYDEIMNKAEYRSDVDFFRTLKQKSKEYGIHWFLYRMDIKNKKNEPEYKAMTDKLDKLNNYLSEISPINQQINIIFDYVLSGVIYIMPVFIFLICFLMKLGIIWQPL